MISMEICNVCLFVPRIHNMAAAQTTKPQLTVSKVPAALSSTPATRWRLAVALTTSHQPMALIRKAASKLKLVRNHSMAAVWMGKPGLQVGAGGGLAEWGVRGVAQGEGVGR